MKDDWNAAVEECKNNGIGHSNDDFILGAVENGNTDMFKRHGITTNVSGYPSILYISSENIRQGNTNHEKFNNPRKKDEFISWIKEKKNRKKSKTQDVKIEVVKKNNIGKQIGGGRSRSRSNRRKHTRKSKRYMKRHTRHHKRSRRHHRYPNMGGGSGCGCGSGGFGSLFK
jgi:hypothetical protein